MKKEDYLSPSIMVMMFNCQTALLTVSNQRGATTEDFTQDEEFNM